MRDRIGDQLLDELFQEPGTVQPAGALTEANIVRLRYRHEALIDLMISQPWLDQNQLAARMGYTASWISTIICSDSFQDALEARRKDIVDPALRASLRDQFQGVLSRSLEIVRKKLDGPAEYVEPQFALRTMEVSSRALGYGARPVEAPKTGDMHVHLHGLADNLVLLLRKTKAQEQPEAIEGEVTHVKQS